VLVNVYLTLNWDELEMDSSHQQLTRMRIALLLQGSQDKVEIPCSPQSCWCLS